MADPWGGLQETVRPVRSLLLVGAGDLSIAERPAAAPADIVVVDVAARVPAADSAASRRSALAFLQTGRADIRQVYVRISGLRSGYAESDLDAVMTGGPDGIMLPDAVGGSDLAVLDARLAVAEALHGLKDGGTRIIAVAQSAAALFALGTLRGVSPRLAGLAWSPEGLGAGIGAPIADTGSAGSPLAVARALCLHAAAAAGVSAIDTPAASETGESDLRSACASAARDGFSAKMATRAEHLAIINAAFASLPAGDDEADDGPADDGVPETGRRARGRRRSGGLMRFRRRS